MGLAALIYLGYTVPLALHEVADGRTYSLGLGDDAAHHLWYLILTGYGLAASVLPVWFLLQPRDYIANWILIVGMSLGFVGLVVSHPPITAAWFTTPMSDQGPVWPMLFVLIACGAISGFHSIVASGTTAKQLRKESEGLLIGYGAMLTEGLLAVLALLAVAAGLGWDAFQAEMSPGGGGAIVAFAKGYGSFVDPIVGAAAGLFFGATMINAFVMTTLDTSVRLTRFISSELLGARIPLMRNRFLASLLAVVPAYLLLASGSKDLLWPMFAAANQLVAGLALIVLSAYLVGVRKPAWATLIPAALMLLTTIAALLYLGYTFLVAYPPDKGPNHVLGAVTAVLLVLSLIVARDAVCMIGARRSAGGSRGLPGRAGSESH